MRTNPTIICILLILAGCGVRARIDPVTSAKAELQSPEQPTSQEARAGRDNTQINVSMAGGGAVAAVMLIVIGAIGWRGSQAVKALKVTTDVIEGHGHLKRMAWSLATKNGIEPYLNKKVRKWYPDRAGTKT